jgi:dolichyl-phosphate beta-glucosyltransferase
VDILISVIIPAYNEARRLPEQLQTLRAYLEGVFADQYEVLVVDDGSRDDTASRVRSFMTSWRQLRLISWSNNQGKGAALRRGVFAARGRLLLCIDADGATPVLEEAKLRQAIGKGADIAVGSRLGCSRNVQRTILRKLASAAFAKLAACLLKLPVRDTQCGFKMFRGSTGRSLFRLCKEPGFLIDLEFLLNAQHSGCGDSSLLARDARVESARAS